MRWFLSKRIPPFTRLLFVESGSRHLSERILTYFYENFPGIQADLLTCYSGAPASFRADSGVIFNVNDFPDLASRRALLAQLARRGYTITGIICSAEPILARWKWLAAARIPAKVFVLNENADFFWLDRGHASTIRHFIAYRAGLTGAGAVRTLARILLFPVTLLYLVAYAAAVHLRRKLRTI